MGLPMYNTPASPSRSTILKSDLAHSAKVSEILRRRHSRENDQDESRTATPSEEGHHGPSNTGATTIAAAHVTSASTANNSMNASLSDLARSQERLRDRIETYEALRVPMPDMEQRERTARRRGYMREAHARTARRHQLLSDLAPGSQASTASTVSRASTSGPSRLARRGGSGQPSPARTMISRMARRGGAWTSPARATPATGGGRVGETATNGLGDRDRSLSPEGDGVWDTLLSSITPDPQPLSAGSSFASSAASDAVSQTTAATSLDTHLAQLGAAVTRLDRAAANLLDHNCDSGSEDEDEGRQGEESTGYDAGGNTNVVHPSHFSSRGIEASRQIHDPPRTYAEVVAAEQRHFEIEHNSLRNELELWGSVDGMQPIIRNLAERQDIPETWWAAAGLSRTLSREASTSQRGAL